MPGTWKENDGSRVKGRIQRTYAPEPGIQGGNWHTHLLSQGWISEVEWDAGWDYPGK